MPGSAEATPPPPVRYESVDAAPDWVLAASERCPSCCGLPTVTPGLWAVRGDTLITAHRCVGCGHGWAQKWAVSALTGDGVGA